MISLTGCGNNYFERVNLMFHESIGTKEGLQADEIYEVNPEEVDRRFLNSEEYMTISKQCSDEFYRLMKTLNQEQKKILFDYEELIAVRDGILIDICLGVS